MSRARLRAYRTLAGELLKLLRPVVYWTIVAVNIVAIHAAMLDRRPKTFRRVVVILFVTLLMSRRAFRAAVIIPSVFYSVLALVVGCACVVPVLLIDRLR